MKPRTVIGVMLAGAAMGTLGDYGHFSRGIDGYPPGGWRLPGLGLPAWVPALFASATLAITAAHWVARRFRGSSHIRRAGVRPTFLAGAASFLTLYLLSALISPQVGFAKDAALALGAGLTWWTLDRTAVGVALAVATATAGVAVEIFLVSRGVFFYFPGSAQFFGVPTWLPWLYMGASVAVGCLAD